MRVEWKDIRILSPARRMRNALRTIGHLPRKLICGLIGMYQATLSPDHGPLKHLHPYGYCRHEPTCSMYAKRVIMERGVILGTPRAILRILSCNPWKQPTDERIISGLHGPHA